VAGAGIQTVSGKVVLSMDSLTAKVLISPGPKTRECYTGNYDHEEQDAQTYAAWLDEYSSYRLALALRRRDGE
jgi:hypothetical protein